MKEPKTHSLKGAMVTNQHGWKSMSADNLFVILKDLPAGSRVGPNAAGNLTIVDSFGKYLGYIDFKKEEMHLMEDF